jgi:hypothetical protein
MTQPIGVSTHSIGNITIPKQLKDILPTVEQLEIAIDAATSTLETEVSEPTES